MAEVKDQEKLEQAAPETAPAMDAPETEGAAPAREEEGQVSLLDMGAEKLAGRLRQVDANTLTPIEALNLIYELKQML